MSYYTSIIFRVQTESTFLSELPQLAEQLCVVLLDMPVNIVVQVHVDFVVLHVGSKDILLVNHGPAGLVE